MRPTDPTLMRASWRARVVRGLHRRRRLSALVPVVVLVLGTPHSCPLC